MVIAKVHVSGVSADAVIFQKIPRGITGAKIEVSFDSRWSGLNKTAVFSGAAIKDVTDFGSTITIPVECVNRIGRRLKVGFYGTSGKDLIIPTLWADLGTVVDATDPSGDTSTDPALPVWAQIQAAIGNLDDLQTETKDTLVGAINEANRNGGGTGGGSGGEPGHYETITELVVKDSDFNIDGFCRPDGSFGTNAGYARTDYVNISAYDSLIVHVRPRTDSVSPCVWFDSGMNYISGEEEDVLTESDYTYIVPQGAVYAIFSSEKTMQKPRTVKGVKTVYVPGTGPSIKESAQAKCYISPNGSDENDGRTAEAPVKTLEKAQELLSGQGELVFLEGDYHNLDFDLAAFERVSAVGNVRLIYAGGKFAEATPAGGYARVYQVPYAGSYTGYLWQFDVPDANTAISEAERHPLQRNRTHRLEHTRMYPVTKFDTTSTDLAGFLETMEATTDKWMYYMDGSNCYFTVPDGDFADHPVIIPGNTTLRASAPRNVNISGLKIYFASILATNLSGVLDGLTVGYHTKSGAIMWDNTFGLALMNCEAVASSNDGINGHTAGDIACYHCWGHDNADDGESDHEDCHIIQYGGLYEYNGNGCTPASGGSGEYINTVCRYNGEHDWASDPAGTGFSAQNTSTTDPAQIYCISCYSYGNKIGFRQKGSSRATFVNCVSRNDETAFGAGAQINCNSADVAVDLTGYATEQYVKEYAQPKGNYLTQHQDISGKLDASALPTAINTALAQAKASGEFDGKTPVKGVDYWTDADQESIVQQVIIALGTPVFGRVDENNNIILTGNLADGVYTLKYEDADGNLMDVGEIDLGPSYTNIIDTVGYTDDIRLSTSTPGTTKAATGYVTTGVADLAAYARPVTVRTSGVNFNDSQAAVAWYDTSGTAKYSLLLSTLIANGDTRYSLDADGNLTVKLYADMTDAQNYSRIQLCGYGKGADLIVTVNQNITDSDDDSGSIELVLTYGVKLDKDTGAEGSATGYAASQSIPYDSAYEYTMSTTNDKHAYGAACWYDATGGYLGWNDIVASGTSGVANSGVLNPIAGASTFRLRIVALNSGDENRISLRKDLIQ